MHLQMASVAHIWPPKETVKPCLISHDCSPTCPDIYLKPRMRISCSQSSTMGIWHRAPISLTAEEMKATSHNVQIWRCVSVAMVTTMQNLLNYLTMLSFRSCFQGITIETVMWHNSFWKAMPMAYKPQIVTVSLLFRPSKSGLDFFFYFMDYMRTSKRPSWTAIKAQKKSIT